MENRMPDDLLLSREAYQTFCKASGSLNMLSWDELPPLIRNAWRLTVAKVILVELRALHPGDPKETEETNVE